jgi:hypothetical protein
MSATTTKEVTMAKSKERFDGLGRKLCGECGIPAHDGSCEDHDITVERVRRIVAEGIAFRRDALTTARIVAEALGI